MGYISEPKGVDFIVAPSELTAGDLKDIRSVITHYKKTGKILENESVEKSHSTQKKEESFSL